MENSKRYCRLGKMAQPLYLRRFGFSRIQKNSRRLELSISKNTPHGRWGQGPGSVDPRFPAGLPFPVPQIPEFVAFGDSGKIFQQFSSRTPQGPRNSHSLLEFSEKSKSSSERVLLNNSPCVPDSCHRGRRQKFARTSRKSSCKRGVFLVVFRDLGWVLGPLVALKRCDL